MNKNSIQVVKPAVYQTTIPGEEIIRSSPSTGLCEVFQCDLFFLNPDPRSRLKQPYKLDYVDPWMVLKSIPDALIVDQHLVLTKDKMALIGLQYHYVTRPNSKYRRKQNEYEFELDYSVQLKGIEPPQIYQVAKDSESFEEVFFLGETDNFGHWLFEFLPKLLWYKKYLFDANINVPILVGEAVPDRWLEVGNPLGIPAENFQRVKLGKTLKIKKLYICGPSIANYFNTEYSFVRADDISELRVIFRKYYKLDLIPKTVDILFETRERSRWRKIVNEDNLISRVKKEVGLNTEKFFPEEMTFKEQIEKLQSSKVFVGTGASLPFSFFMCKDSVLVEVRNPTGSGFATNIASDIFRIPWYRPTTKNGETNSGPTAIDVDLIIDETEFLNNMKRINELLKNCV